MERDKLVLLGAILFIVFVIFGLLFVYLVINEFAPVKNRISSLGSSSSITNGKSVSVSLSLNKNNKNENNNPDVQIVTNNYPQKLKNGYTVVVFNKDGSKYVVSNGNVLVDGKVLSKNNNNVSVYNVNNPEFSMSN